MTSSLSPSSIMWSSIHAACSSSSSSAKKICNRYLLTGDASSGRSSLAMNLAHDSALATGGSALYVCRRPTEQGAEDCQQEQQRFPLFISSCKEGEVNSSTWDARGLASVQVKYVSRRSDLINVLSRIALCDPMPNCLIIDDLSLIIDPTSSDGSRSRAASTTNHTSNESSLEVLMLIAYAIDDAVSHIEKVMRAQEEPGAAQGPGVGCIRLLIVDSSSDIQRTAVINRVVDASLRLQRWSEEPLLPGAVLLLAGSKEEEAIFRYREADDGKTLRWELKSS